MFDVLAGMWRWRGGALVAVLLAVVFCAGCGGKKVEAESSDDAFQTGWINYRLLDWTRAMRCFEMSVALATNDTQRMRGLYSQADVWNFATQGRSADRAVGLYKRVVEEDTEGVWAPWAALALARMEHTKASPELPEIKVLEEAYGKVIDNYPGHVAADEAFMHLQHARLVRGEDETIAKAIAETEAWVEARKDSVFLPTGYGVMAHGHMLQGRGKEYIDALVAAVELSLQQQQNSMLPPTDQVGNYFRIGMAAQLDSGDFDVAREYFKKMIETSPWDQRIFLVEQRLKMMDEFEERVREELRREKGE